MEIIKMANISRASKKVAAALGTALAASTPSFAQAACDVCTATTPEEFKNMTGLVLTLDEAKDEPGTYNGVTVENGGDLEALGITSLKQTINGKVNDNGFIEPLYTATASILGGACPEVTYSTKLRNQGGAPVGFQTGYLNKDWRWAGSEPFAPNGAFIPGNAFSATATNTVGDGLVRIVVVADKRIIAEHAFAKTPDTTEKYDPSRTAVVIDPSSSGIGMRPKVYTAQYKPETTPELKPY